MSDLLTTRQLQDLLQLDRTTIYRMIQEGQLPAFKVGGHWRFSRKVIESWLEQQSLLANAVDIGDLPDAMGDVTLAPDALPLPCVQALQDVLADSLEVGTVTTRLDGTPLTLVSNSCAYCDLILGSKGGRQRCISSWEVLSRQPNPLPELARCHAGLQYGRGRVMVGDSFLSMFFGGQFLVGAQPVLLQPYVEEIASNCAIPYESLWSAAQEVRLVDRDRVQHITRLLQRAADAISQVAQERHILLMRLQRIARLSAL